MPDKNNNEEGFTVMTSSALSRNTNGYLGAGLRDAPLQI